MKGCLINRDTSIQLLAVASQLGQWGETTANDDYTQVDL